MRYPVETLYAKAVQSARYWPDVAAADRHRCLCFFYCRAEIAISSQWMSASVQFRQERIRKDEASLFLFESFDIFPYVFHNKSQLGIGRYFMNDCQKLSFAPSSLRNRGGRYFRRPNWFFLTSQDDGKAFFLLGCHCCLCVRVRGVHTTMQQYRCLASGAGVQKLFFSSKFSSEQQLRAAILFLFH